MRWQFVEDRAFLEVPDEALAVLGSGGQVPVALADVDVRDYVLVPVQGCLQGQGIFVPDFQNSI